MMFSSLTALLTALFIAVSISLLTVVLISLFASRFACLKAKPLANVWQSTSRALSTGMCLSLFLSLSFGLMLPSTAQAESSAKTKSSVQVKNSVKPTTILIMGDSLSAGFGLLAGEEWPALLENALKSEQQAIRLINASVSGETSLGGKKRLKPLLKKHQPDIVFIELGANDGLQGQSLKTMRKHLRKMIEYSHNHQAKVILAGMRIPPNYGKRYSEKFYAVYTELAKNYPVSFIPFLLADIAGHPELNQADGIHPTKEAQPIILQHVKPIFDQLLN